LYAIYKDSEKAFKTHNFIDFKQLLEYRYEQIHVKWDLDMNDILEVLAFTAGGKILKAKHDDMAVMKEVWEDIVSEVKCKCAGML
jgi:hypothetical protein